MIQRGWIGPSKCCLCKSEEEYVDHIFVVCSFAQEVRSSLAYFLKRSIEWKEHSLLDNLNSWTEHEHKLLYMPFFYIWNIWIARNICIFEE